MAKPPQEPFAHSELLPLGPDTTEYRLLTTQGVSTFSTSEGTFLKVSPQAITHLTEHAMRDIAHLLRTSHLQQLASILKDPEASDNDRFVALDLLKNASIAAGGILPMCQDTGTAIVKAKRVSEYLPVVATMKPSAAASTTHIKPATFATANLHRCRCLKKSIPTPIFQPKSKSPQLTATNTNFYLLPRVAVQPTRVICFKRRRRCSTKNIVAVAV